MARFMKCPGWAFKLFEILCFYHVIEQLPENLLIHIFPLSNPPSFVCEGQLFAFTHHRLLISEVHLPVNDLMYN